MVSAPTREQADIAFERGDYLTAHAQYASLLERATSGIEPEIPEELDRRVKSLTLDRFALALGLGSLGIIFTSYVLAVALG